MKKTYRKKVSKRYNKYKQDQTIKEKIEKRYKVLITIICVILSFLMCTLFYIQIIKNSFYKERVAFLTQNIVYGNSVPRGRIYDRNGKVLVDNVAVKVISYKKNSGISTSEEINMAYKIASLIEMNTNLLNNSDLKKFWIVNNADLAKIKITSEEWRLLEERKITQKEIEKLKLERITEEDLKQYTEIDQEAALVYTLMNKGYSYSEKEIKKNVTDVEYALVAENIEDLPGFSTKLDWDRIYPYGSTFRSILGNVSTRESGIPYELKNHYLALGYSLNDRVGTSYLEYQYEHLLKGEKALYKISNIGDNILLEEGKRGNDIVLTIDIDLQIEVEKILEQELVKAKKEANTEYYNKSFVVITNPKTGEILAMSGKQIIQSGESYKMYDYTPGVLTSSVVAGSIVKGASQIVGYNTGALEIGEVRSDDCIKIAATPLKCSWKYLDNIDDIEALKYSSNTYQFNTAINVGKGVYRYDKPLILDQEAFSIYRNTFAEFGLGVKTGIDLPNESLGYMGTSTLSGHLFDFSIGQYDTYTPIQLAQYINTIANGGMRLSPYLLKAVYEPTSDPLTNLITETKPNILNELNTNIEYLNRVKLGFQAVMEKGGTGSGYINLEYKPAGKTGTSQSFIDSDGDGKVDKETISATFAAYAPYDNPIVSFTVVSPDIYHYGNNSSLRTNVNMRISKEVSKKFFEIYQ
ncbi:MAG: penicillin-binding protein 2 [Firmicutes bacterium]|nr:penicillin-binding protein 2 [Bacillota bacterium]